MAQRIPSIASRVKRRVDLRPIGLALLAAVGCGPIVEQAAFPARPDTLRPGDLLGPFDGIVLDAETDRPVAGATVAASWAFERGVGLVGPLGAHEQVTETGADGRYRIAPLKNFPSGASARVQRFTMIVYHRGHVGWRSDRRFPGLQARRDFAQRGNKIRLEKWQTTFQHHQHLVYLGGGDAIKAAASWEVQPASLELEGTSATASKVGAVLPALPVKTLDARPLLSEEEVRGVTGYPGSFEVGKLGDLPSTEFYDSSHFKAVGKPESFDVGLRVWALGEAGAEAQYRKLQTELPGATTTDEIGDAALRARAGEVLGLAFLQRERGIVVSVTCGTGQCTEASMILRLGKLIEGHLPGLTVPKNAGPP